MFAFALAFLVHIGAHARVDVAFVQMYRPDGSIIQLEPEGQFAHVAISYQGGWLQAYPGRGVEWITSTQLDQLGSVVVVTLDHLPDLTEWEIWRYLGKDYDYWFSWDDESYYCSELVAKILGLPPEPMYFDENLWPEEYLWLNGEPGLSPDDIFEILTR